MKERYNEYYSDHAPFNELALAPASYLIIGRRGSGKSSLAHYFTFQKQTASNRGAARLLADILRALFHKLVGRPETDVITEIEDSLRSEVFEKAKTRTLAATRRSPVIVAVDSLEHYPVDNEMLMKTTAALIQAASDFNLRYRANGVHVKVFLSSEVAPFLVENVLANPLKHSSIPCICIGARRICCDWPAGD